MPFKQRASHVQNTHDEKKKGSYKGTTGPESNPFYPQNPAISEIKCSNTIT